MSCCDHLEREGVRILPIQLQRALNDVPTAALYTGLFKTPSLKVKDCFLSNQFGVPR